MLLLDSGLAEARTVLTNAQAKAICPRGILAMNESPAFARARQRDAAFFLPFGITPTAQKIEYITPFCKR